MEIRPDSDYLRIDFAQNAANVHALNYSQFVRFLDKEDMHNQEIDVLDKRVVESPELLGKECITCYRILEYAHFRADHTYRDGRRDQCTHCEASPRLSTAEHTARLRELNYNSVAVQRQRWEHQEEYRNDAARIGRPMHHTDLLAKLEKLIPSLYIVEGRIVGDLAIYRTFSQPQPQLEGRTFEYLFYTPTGYLPEYSIIEFDEIRDVPIREKMRGWRTVLLRLIKAGLITESECNRNFGHATGQASSVWYRKLSEHRNN